MHKDSVNQYHLLHWWVYSAYNYREYVHVIAVYNYVPCSYILISKAPSYQGRQNRGDLQEHIIPLHTAHIYVILKIVTPRLWKISQMQSFAWVFPAPTPTAFTHYALLVPGCLSYMH